MSDQVVANTPVPNPVPFDALVIRTDLELGGERIRMTEVVLDYGPQRDEEERLRVYRAAMAKVSDALLIALNGAGWGTK